MKAEISWRQTLSHSALAADGLTCPRYNDPALYVKIFPDGRNARPGASRMLWGRSQMMTRYVNPTPENKRRAVEVIASPFEQSRYIADNTEKDSPFSAQEELQ